MDTRPNKTCAALDIALAAASALSLAVMLWAAADFILADEETRGGLAVIAAAGAAFALCPLAARLLRGCRRDTLMLAAVFLAAFALRAAYVLEARSVPASDFGQLYYRAEAFANGAGAAAFEGVYYELWGYQIPFTLYEAAVIALGGGWRVLGLANALYGAATAAAVFHIARSFAGAGAAFSAAMLYALCPAAILLTPVLTAQHLSLMCFTLAAAAYLRGGVKPALAAGALLAAGNLLRPEGIVLACGMLAAAVLGALRRDKSPRAALAELAALAAAFAAVTLAVRGGIALSGIAPQGTGSAAPEWKFVLGLDTASEGRYDPAMERILAIADPAERREAALAAIRASLGGCGDLFGFFRDKTLRFWGEYEESWLGVADEYIHTLRYWDRIFFMAASALALIGCLSGGESAAESLARGTVFANFTVYLFIEVQPRYRHFVWPFLIILAAAGVKRLSAAYGHLRRKLL